MTVIADRYEVVAEHGGGQARVVEAVDLRHGRRVGLKMRPAAGADRQELLAEARALLDLRPHAGLPVAREDFFWGDEYVLVTDWVAGADMAGRVVPAPEALLVAQQVADALDHLHTHEPPIVHGDVKPANIVVTSGGRAVLVDLGLVGLGASVGTVGFVAPEVVAGQAPTTAADVYGLAATVFTFLSGRPPLEGPPANVDPRLIRALRTGLATDPAKRPPSASALVEGVLEAIAGELPEGTATFLFTDIEGSTRLWDERGPVMARVLSDHDATIQALAAAHGGRNLRSKGEGDSTVSVFADATAAVRTAIDFQLAVAELGAELDLRVRMSVHTGVVELRDGDYFGSTLNRAARLRAVAHGGQIVVSEVVADAVGHDALEDLGVHRLRDLSRPEHVYQVLDPRLPREFPPLTSIANRRTNLPSQATAFVGREDELTRVAELLSLSRLVTLTGPGGSGKTRLALQAGAELLDRFVDGVWFVELAPVTEPGAVSGAVAAALGIAPEPFTPVVKALVDGISSRESLLILDNCEHVVDGAADLIQALLDGCPNLRLLATSRERLRLPGETLWSVPVLGLPHAGEDPIASEAVQLFLNRALAAKPGFTATGDNLDAVVEICERLEGIPLALELAAARVTSLSARQLAERLDQRFALLSGGSRGVLPRQRNLRAMIDWSYDLLPPTEQTMLRRLAVFRGGWALDAAEHIGATIDDLQGLVDKSLVLVDDGDDGEPPRYRMLETVREYGIDRLDEAGEHEEGHRRHAEEMARFADDLWARREHLDGALRAQGMREADNLTAALSWSCRQDPELAGRMYRVLGVLHSLVVHPDSMFWAGQVAAAARAMSPALRAVALTWTGIIAGYGGEPDSATTWFHDAVAAGRQSGDDIALGYALLFSGAVARLLGRRDEMKAAITEALALAEGGSDSLLLGVAHVLAGWLAMDAGDDEEVWPHIDAAQALAERDGNWYVLGSCLDTRIRREPDLDAKEALLRRILDLDLGLTGSAYTVRADLARLAERRGDLDAAIEQLEALAEVKDIGNFRYALSIGQELAVAYLRKGRPADALRVMGPWERGERFWTELDRHSAAGLLALCRFELGEVEVAERQVWATLEWLITARPEDTYLITPQGRTFLGGATFAFLAARFAARGQVIEAAHLAAMFDALPSNDNSSAELISGYAAQGRQGADVTAEADMWVRGLDFEEMLAYAWSLAAAARPR